MVRADAPKGTPAPVVERMHKELAAALRQPDVLTRFGEQGVTAGDLGPAPLGQFILAETAKWGRIVKERAPGSTRPGAARPGRAHSGSSSACRRSCCASGPRMLGSE